MKSLLDADYAAIEARIVCWLAGQKTRWMSTVKGWIGTR